MTKSIHKDGDHEEDGEAAAALLQRLRRLQGKAREASERTAAAEQIIDEMARRQGHTLGPFFEWHRATPEFTSRFNQAYEHKAVETPLAEFARSFVDAWPAGAAALQLLGEGIEAELFAKPPYAKDGMWPAVLGKSESK